MKARLYSSGNKPELISRVGGNGRRLTAEEYALLEEGESGGAYATRRSLLASYLAGQPDKLPALGAAVREASARGCRGVLSLGAGACVLEFLMSLAVPEGTRVAAADFNPFTVEKAAAHFPEIAVRRFDFFGDDAAALVAGLGFPVDLAVFFGSAYVMEDAEFVRLFRRLRECGVGRLIDFHAGYLDWRLCLRELNPLSHLKKAGFLRRLFGRGPLGKFHGYGRSRGELRRLYREAGWTVLREMSPGCYKYAAVMVPSATRKD
jgi:hypothetical protein